MPDLETSSKSSLVGGGILAERLAPQMLLGLLASESKDTKVGTTHGRPDHCMPIKALDLNSALEQTGQLQELGPFKRFHAGRTPGSQW